MSKVLLIVAHPDLATSKYNAALLAAADGLDDVTVHDLSAAYPDGVIDASAEQQLLVDHDVVVFQHPVYWYSVPALFRQWQDAVLTYNWAFTYDGTASELNGKKAIVAVTTGGSAENYTVDGMNGATIETLLSSWKATLTLCQFDVQPIFALHGTALGPGVSDDELAAAVRDYRELLSSHTDSETADLVGSTRGA